MMEGMVTPPRDAPLEGMLNWVAYAATGIELLAVVIIVVVIIFATVSYSIKILVRQVDKLHTPTFGIASAALCCWALKFWWRLTSSAPWCWSRPCPTCWFWDC